MSKPRSALFLAALVALLPGCASGPGQASTTTIDPKDPVLSITAHQWAFDPATITLHEGAAVTLEITSEDVHHGFNLPDFGIRADVVPGTTTRLRFVPDKKGTFPFLCDYYCGGGHEDMTGTIVVQ